MTKPNPDMDSLSQVVRSVALEMKAHRVMGSRIEELDDWSRRLSSAIESPTPAEARGEVTDALEVLKELPELLLLANSDPAHERLRGIAPKIRATHDDYATLARQLATTQGELDDYKNAALHSADDLRAKDEAIATLASQLAEAKADNDRLKSWAEGPHGVRWYQAREEEARTRAEQAEAQLQSCKDKLAAVEGLPAKWEQGIGADHRRICANQLRAALQPKESKES